MPEREAERDRRETRSAAVVAGGILLSKLVGLLRHRVTAFYFGTGAVADVIAAAFRIGNVTQNLLGEGTLSASFIPVYAKLRAEKRDTDAVAFARAALGALIVVVILLSALGVACAPWLALAVAGGFSPEKLEMTTRLVRIVFPMTGVLVLCAWALGVLNSHRKFFLPYAAPVVWSAFQIAALLIAGGWLMTSGEALAKALAIGALAGAGVELIVLLWRTKPLLGTLRPRLAWRNEALQRAAKRMPAVLLGRGVIQLSGLIDTLLVSFIGIDGANATFAYAQMLYLLPMSLLGTGEAAVALPEMARDSALDNEAERATLMRRRLIATLTRVGSLAIPAMVVLILFGHELISLLLRTGRFDQSSTERVAAALSVYGFALLGNASQRLFATTFFALGDTRQPARFAVVRVVWSTVVALLLMDRLGVVGVVIGAASAAWIECFLLGAALRRRLGGLSLGQLPWLRLALLTAVCAGPAYGLRHLFPAALARGLVGSVAVLSCVALSFALAAPALGLYDWRQLLRRGRQVGNKQEP